MKDLIERLRGNTLEITAAAEQAADLLECIYAQPVELPENLYSKTGNINDFCKYSHDQLTQAVQEATARALEAAEKECDARYMGDNNREDMEARRCADAIRNLIGRVK